MTEKQRVPFSLSHLLLIAAIGSWGAAGVMHAAAQTALSLSGATFTNAAPTANNEAPGKVVPSPTGRQWGQLTPLQRQALAPLGAQWGALTWQQQTKWIALSKNFTQLPVESQITMHSRMADWVDLSPQQRNLARLNFNQFQNLAKEDKKAKWEAYQALPKEEKRLLSASTASPAKSAAPTIKPLEVHRQVQTPVKAAVSAHAAATIDRKTLLPRPPASVPSAPNVPTPPATDMPEGVKAPSETAPS